MAFLSLSNKDLVKIDYINNDIDVFFCYNNLLEELPPLPLKLEILDCANNKLRYLPQLPNTITELYCFKNCLTKLPQLPINLKYLECENNPLSILPTLPYSLDGIRISLWQLHSCLNNLSNPKTSIIIKN